MPGYIHPAHRAEGDTGPMRICSGVGGAGGNHKALVLASYPDVPMATPAQIEVWVAQAKAAKQQEVADRKASRMGPPS